MSLNGSDSGLGSTRERPNLTIVVASTRPRRTGPLIAEWIARVARAHGAFDVALADLAEIDLPFLDEPDHASEGAYQHEHTLRWSATIEDSDGMTSAGLRAVEGTMPILTALRMMPIPDAMSIALRHRIDEEKLLRPDEAMNQAGHTMLTELCRLAAALRSLRDPRLGRARETVAS